MKKHVLLLAGCLALVGSVQGQNDPAPTSPALTNAPTSVIPAVATNAPAAEVIPSPVTPVVPSSTVATTNASVASSNLSTNNELVPLIVIDDVPLIDAVKNLARQAGLELSA